MKLRNIQKVAKTARAGKKCDLIKKRKSDFPQHPVLTRLLPKCKSTISYDKQAYYITESAGNILVLILFYFIVVFPQNTFAFIFSYQVVDILCCVVITSLHNVTKATEGKQLLHVTTFCRYMQPFSTKMQELRNHASPIYFAYFA